jgi:hypothetical protein
VCAWRKSSKKYVFPFWGQDHRKWGIHHILIGVYPLELIIFACTKLSSARPKALFFSKDLIHGISCTSQRIPENGGLKDVRLRLGSLPYDYIITAKLSSLQSIRSCENQQPKSFCPGKISRFPFLKSGKIETRKSFGPLFGRGALAGRACVPESPWLFWCDSCRHCTKVPVVFPFPCFPLTIFSFKSWGKCNAQSRKIGVVRREGFDDWKRGERRDEMKQNEIKRISYFQFFLPCPALSQRFGSFASFCNISLLFFVRFQLGLTSRIRAICRGKTGMLMTSFIRLFRVTLESWAACSPFLLSSTGFGHRCSFNIMPFLSTAQSHCRDSSHSTQLEFQFLWLVAYYGVPHRIILLHVTFSPNHVGRLPTSCK